MEVMTLSVNAPAPVFLNKALPSTETFTYLGSVVRQDGGTKEDIHSRLSKATNAFRGLNAVWRSSQYSIKTKVKLYQSCVLSTLFYRSECWRMTEYDLAKLSFFHRTNLRKIQRIFWPRTISNRDLVPARGYGDHHHQKAMALNWARAAQECQLHHQSCGPLDPREKAEAWSTEDNPAKNCGRRKSRI